MERSLKVSEFIAVVNDTLTATLPSVLVEGEIAGYKVWNGRLAFFDLKDDEAAINCMLPLGLQRTPLEDGMQVRLRIEPRLRKNGRFSANVKTVELIGEGALLRAFEMLKAKLEKEGLFAPERKRQLPQFPETIGVVTSLDSAAYRDFLKILDARWKGVEVRARHAQVQGEVAPEQIVAAVQYFNSLPEPPDVLVVIRGGGSLEDLAAFNTEPVVQVIAASRVPTVVGVGHEVDTSLADLAADLRAATPSDAARLVVPDRRELQGKLSGYQQLMLSSTERLLERNRRSLDGIFTGFDHFLAIPRQQLDLTVRTLRQKTEYLLRSCGDRADSLRRTLRGYDPKAALERGYAVVRSRQQILRDTSGVSPGDMIMIQLAKGEIDSEVKDVRPEK